MEWIEFIGPSGVGKTFLFNELVKSRTKEEIWITPEEAADLIYSKEKYWKWISKKDLLRNLIREKLLQKKSHVRAKFPVNHRLELINRYGKEFEIHAELFLKRLHDREDFNYRKKLKMASWYYSSRLEPFILLYGSNLNLPIFFEDGIIHNNSGFRFFEEYVSHNQGSQKTIPLPDVIILILAEPETIFNRIKKRNKIGNGTFLQRDLSDRDIMKHVKRSIDDKTKIANSLNKCGCKVLKIDAENSVKFNSKRINKFLKNSSTKINTSKIVKK